MRNTLHRFRALHSHQSGDTIVEVLICLAVIAVILTGAFLVSNQSSATVRTSEEHAQALQYIQGQIEQLRADAAGKIYATMPSSFCYMSDGTFSTGVGGTACKQGLYYNLMIEKVAGPAGGNDTATFKATVQWDALGGGSNQEHLFYRTQVAG